MEKNAFPLAYTYKDRDGDESTAVFEGLTKREWFAGMAMQGFLSNDVMKQR